MVPNTLNLTQNPSLSTARPKGTLFVGEQNTAGPYSFGSLRMGFSCNGPGNSSKSESDTQDLNGR